MHRRSLRNLLFVILFSCVASLSVKAENEPKFIENKGQLPAQVSHKLRVANSDIYFEKDKLTFNIYAPHLLDQHDHGNEHESELLGHAYYMRFVGASNQASVESAGNQYPDYTNYITPDYSASHVRSYDRLQYKGIYPGIDIAYFGKEGNLKYDVIVSAGADANVLKMQYDGADALYLKNGKLIVVNAFNSVEESIPLAYQIINGTQKSVECRYVLNGTTVSFEFPNGYDSSKELVIDPTLVFSSYTGSTSNNFGFTATYDQNGALYGGGIDFGLGYPTVPGSYSVAFNGGSIDIAISKFSANGTSLIYSTYLGGNNTEAPHSMIVNSQGQLVILGSTSSTNYPTSVGAYDNAFNGGTAVNYASNGVNFQNGSDIVVSILSADGSALVGSTFLGGSLNDGVNDDATLSFNYGDIFRGEVVVDAADNIYITSSTGSSNFPTTSGTIDQTLGGTQDAICAKFNSNVSNLLWSTYLGGSGADAGYSLKLNSSGDIYFVGGTVGQSFPIVGNTLNTTYQGGTVDGYVAHISNDGSTLLSSSYIGTSSYDQVYFVEVDTHDDVYLYGQSEGNYPVTGGVYSNTNGKQFIQKLSPDLSTSIFSTVFGSGSAAVNISPTAFLVDNCQRIFISGWGGGTNNFWNATTGNTNGMATTSNGQQLTTDGSDFYFMVLEANAASLLYGSYFGGNGVQEHVDGGTSRFNKDGVIHQAVCAGCGGSNAFPTTPGVVSNINGNSCNLGVIKLDLGVSTVDVEIDGSALPTQCLQVPATISFQANVLIADEFEWFFGDGATSTLPNPSHTYTNPGTYEITLVGRNPFCDLYDTSSVTLVTILPADTANAGLDVQICLGDSVQLQASGGDAYSWLPIIGLSNPSISNPMASPAVTTQYVLNVTTLDGCASTDAVTVTVLSTNFQVSADETICIGNTTQISASGASTYLWSPNVDISNPNISNPQVFPASTRTYYVEGTDANGCDVSDSVTITVQALPTAFAGYDQGVCGGGTAQLNATGGVNYSWSPTSGLSNPNVFNPVITFSTDTVTYVVTVTDNIGCQDSDTVTVWQEPLPDAQAGPDTTICAGETVQLTSSGGQTYSWLPTAGLNNPNIPNPTATPLATTTYTVTVGQPSGNHVYNGNFSQGNVGFSSDYNYATQLNPAGLYSVVTNANAVHNAFQGTGHTGNAPQDSFMVVNGAGVPNLNVWCQTISVSPNTDYFFGAWVSTVVANNPAILQFSINGQVLGSPFSAPFNINNWVQFYQTWNSGSATSATICVVNQNTTTGGNDFALDDITFSTFCTNTADVTVTVNPLPTANAGPDQSICIGETTQMAGSGGTTYQWVPPIALADPTNPTTDANPIITRTYTLIVQDNIGCEATDQMTLTVNPLPQANAGPDHLVCAGVSVVLEGSGGTSYVWSPSTYLDNANAQLPIATAETTTTYTVTVTDNNQCSNTDQVTVTVNPLPIVDAGLDSLICPNASLILHATGANTYLWSPLVGLSDPQSANPAASPLQETTYIVTGTDANGCVNSDSVNISIFGVAANSGDYVLCLNDSVQALVSGGATYSWSPTDGVSNPSSATPYLSPETTTNYLVSVTSTFGCLAETEVTVQVLILPIAGFVATFDASCDGIFASFDNLSANAQTYSWSFGDGTTSNENEPTHTYEVGPGNVITLVAYNNDSLCVDSLTIDYSNQWFGNDSIEIEYANIFTPNYDGVNDCFKPEFDGRFSDCYELKVFNRWGALLFESVAGQNHCWDGRTKGGLLVPEGTYYYISIVRGMDHAGYVTVVYK